MNGQKLERVGFAGWRGMVGSVLLERMKSEGDFAGLTPEFFSTSQVGADPPAIGVEAPPLADAHDVERLARQDVIVSCQGSLYTHDVLPALRASGWQGFWIDAASAKRLDDDCAIVLDPVNRALIDRSLRDGVRTFAGGNCTVSLMLMALIGLIRQGWVEWIATSSYQAASGAGARHVRELVQQMQFVGDRSADLLADPATAILDVDRRVTESVRDAAFPRERFEAPLAASLIPWIDRAVENGATREEWKAYAEGNKILGGSPPIPIDGTCVRVPAMRCHSQAFTLKLTRDVPVDELEAALADGHEWMRVVPNRREDTLDRLSPAAVSGTLDIAVGRVRKLRIGPSYASVFSVGDQLLWGAAEPLRRMLRILREHSS